MELPCRTVKVHCSFLAGSDFPLYFSASSAAIRREKVGDMLGTWLQATGHAADATIVNKARR